MKYKMMVTLNRLRSKSNLSILVTVASMYPIKGLNN